MSNMSDWGPDHPTNKMLLDVKSSILHGIAKLLGTAHQLMSDRDEYKSLLDQERASKILGPNSSQSETADP